MFDIIIKNGQILDGTGKERFKGDVGIKDDTIAAVGDLGQETAREIIDAKGHVVAPGFIDVHSHADAVVWAMPNYKTMLLQGVTTELTGSCGISLAPCSDRYLDMLRSYIQALAAGQQLSWTWRSFHDLMQMLEEQPLPTNVMPLVGHGTVRVAIMGFDNRPPSTAELLAMQGLVREAMEAGAFGMSSGLVYPPGNYAPTTELVSLCDVVAQQGGLYSTHVRNESHQVVPSIAEAIDIAEQSGVTLLLSHFKAMGKSNWDKIDETIALVEQARERGMDVWMDQYPYTANSTLLNACVPPWAHQGAVSALLDRLRDPAQREKIIHTIENVNDGSWENFIFNAGGWDGVLVCSIPNNSSLEGKTFTELAQELNKTPGNVLADMLIEQGGSGTVVTFSMSEDNVKKVMAHPAQVVGSDGIPSLGKPHPRMAGTFPRVLGKYVREEGVLTLEEAVHKMTGRSAAILGLNDRGLLQTGCKADITVFDPLTIRDRATYLEPWLEPQGIPYVLVNGRVAVREGEAVNYSGGCVIRRP